jgi:hypothetical protein
MSNEIPDALCDAQGFTSKQAKGHTELSLLRVALRLWTGLALQTGERELLQARDHFVELYVG